MDCLQPRSYYFGNLLFQNKSDSPQVKWDLTSARIDFVYELPDQLPNDLNLGSLEN